MHELDHGCHQTWQIRLDAHDEIRVLCAAVHKPRVIGLCNTTRFGACITLALGSGNRRKIRCALQCVGRDDRLHLSQHQESAGCHHADERKAEHSAAASLG